MHAGFAPVATRPAFGAAPFRHLSRFRALRGWNENSSVPACCRPWPAADRNGSRRGFFPNFRIVRNCIAKARFPSRPGRALAAGSAPLPPSYSQTCACMSGPSRDDHRRGVTSSPSPFSLSILIPDHVCERSFRLAKKSDTQPQKENSSPGSFRLTLQTATVLLPARPASITDSELLNRASLMRRAH